MKVLFPRYEDYVLHWSKETYEREVNEEGYFKSLDDVKNYILRKNDKITIEICEDIKSQIENAIEKNILIQFLTEDLKEFKKSNNVLLLSYPFGEVRNYWIAQNDLLIQEYRALMSKNSKFIKENKDAVFEFLNEKRHVTVQQIKEKRKEANKIYYEKRKSLLKLDEEQPKVELTEDEKKEKKKLANKKYYEKKIAEKVEAPMKPILTEEEKKERRKEANKRYYEKKKLSVDNKEV